MLDDPDFAGRPRHHVVHRDAPAAADRPRPAATAAASCSTYLADVTVNQPHGAGAGERRPGRPSCRRLDLERAGARRHPPAAARGRAGGVRPPAARAAAGRGHRHHVPRRPPVAARHPGAHPRPARRRRPRRAHHPASCGRSRPGAARRTTWRCASSAEDPWERLAALRQAVPNICLQMLLRGRNTVGYTPYPTEVTDAFVEEAAATGIDVFRIFDALNDVEQMRPGDRGGAGDRHGRRRGRALLHRRPLGPRASGSTRSTTTSTWPQRIVDAGAHVLAIKDMAGLLRAPAARTLVTALRERFDLPVHLHTHDTAGGQLATLLAAIDAGVDAVDAATASMAGTTSQPPLSALVSATDHSERETGLSLAAVCALEPYWEATRRVYAPFESGLPAPTGRVYTPRDPRRAALQPAPAGDRARPGREVRADRGHVRRGERHPRQHRQGDAVVQGRRRPGAAAGRHRRRPGRVRRGPRLLRHPRLGDRLPQRRARRPARRLARAVPHQGARGPHLEAAGRRADRRAAARACGVQPRARRSTSCCSPARRRSSPSRARSTATCRCCRPSTTSTGCARARSTRSRSPRASALILGLQAISDADERGFRTVMATINGQLRPISVRDRERLLGRRRRREGRPRQARPGRRAVPGRRSRSWSRRATRVAAGDTVATIEAMKMEASITAPVAGTVQRIAISGPAARRGRRPGAGAGLSADPSLVDALRRRPVAC